jgi:lysophospholipase
MAFVHVAGNPDPVGAEELWLEGRGGAKLRAMWAPALGSRPRGSVIVFPGRTEFIEKYFEVACELQSRGFTVFVMDWRGQGLSDRPLPNRLKGHVADFDDLVGDVDVALRLFGQRLPRPHLALSHSMGGLICLRALQTHRFEAAGAVYTAPMWGVPSMQGLAEPVAKLAVEMGFSTFFVPGVERRWMRRPYHRNALTGDRERYARWQGLVAAEPKLAIAGPTFGWVAAAIQAMDALRQPGTLNHVRIPSVIVSAGKESLVDNRSQKEIGALLPNCRRLVIADAQHEILVERDEVRAQFWAAFDALADVAAPAVARAPAGAG